MKRTDWELAFARRFERHEEELRWLFMELYHNDLRAYDGFTEMLYRLYEERPEDLRRMDEAAVAEIDAGMVAAVVAPEGHDVAGPHLVPVRHGVAHARLLLRRAGQIDACALVGPLHQP